MWFLYSAAGYILLALVCIVDKFLLSSAKVKPALYTFFSSAPLLPVIILYFFHPALVSGWVDWWWAIACGTTYTLAMWTMFLGFEKSEVSHVGPLIGAASPLFVLIFSNLFLGEALVSSELWAVGLLILGSILIAFEKSKKHNGLHLGMLYGILSGLFFAISYVSAKYLYDKYGFTTGFVWSRFFIGVSGLFFLFSRETVRSLLHPIWMDKLKKKFVVKKNKHTGLIISNKILAVVAVLAIQYATAIGSVSLVSALGGLQYAVLILGVMVISRFWPKVFKEDYTQVEIVQEFLAVALIAGGLILLV